MTHDAFAEKLLDLAYGELSPREAGKVEAHAASCEACRAELARIRETRGLMARLPVEPAPEKGERILLAAAREAAERRAPRRSLSPWIWRSMVVAASLALVVAVSYRFAEMRPAPLTPKAADERLLGGGYAAAPAAPAPRAEPPAEAAGTIRGREERYGARADAGERPAPLPPARAEAKKAALPREEKPSRAFAQAPPASAPAAPSGSAVASGSAGAAAPPVERRALSAPSGRAEASQADAVAAAPPPHAQAPALRAPGPAQELQELRAEAQKDELGTRRRAAPAAKAAAAPEAARPRASLGFAGGALGTEVRTFDRCEGELSRQVQVDGEGRVVRYVREGRFGGRRIRVVHLFRPDGALAAVTAQDLDAGGAPVDPRAIGIDIPERAAEATLDAPPRCGR